MTTRISAVISAFAIIISAHGQTKEAGIVAHRGFWNCEEAGFTKNSIAALRCAQEAGFWGSEFDVNMTSDGVLLVYHDANVKGISIEQNPYETFRNHRLQNGEPIPTIDQYLEQGQKYPGTMLVYELKKHSCPEAEDRLVDLSIEKLREYSLLSPERVMFISFSFHICKRLAEKLPGFTVQYLQGDKSPKKVADSGISGIDYHHNIFNISPKWISDAHRLGMSVNAWTVNDTAGMKTMLKAGVDYLTTDNPLEARKVMKDLGISELK